MNLKYALTGVAIVAASQVSFAQYSSDAFRFSQTQNGATSRIKAIGGATTAVGGDLSSVSGNPAGIGFFTRSELSVTPEFNNSQVNSSYFGQNNYSGNNKINLNNASVVFYNQLSTARGKDKTTGWLSFNLGASYNRTNNFYRNEYYSGVNRNGSITDYYSDLANTDNPGNSLLGLTNGTLQAFAQSQGLISLYNNGGTTPGGNAPGDYLSNVISLNNNQASRTTSTGGQSETSLSAGANYSNKLYLGFGIGITSLRYNKSSTFDENGTASILAPGSTTTTINSAYTSQFYQDQATVGTGFNAKLGFIYKPVEAVRIGASFTSPTWMTINDNYAEALQTEYAQDPGAYGNSGDPIPATYNLRTPLKASGGVAVFIGKYGFISGDVEYVDYKGMKLSSGDYNVTQDNFNLSTLYKSTVNTRIGAEAKLDDFFLRGGFNYQGNPYVSNSTTGANVSGPVKTTSAGIGYRFGKYYIDATYQYVTRNTTAYPYEFDPAITTDASPAANLKNKYNNAFLTLGLRF